MSASSTPCLRAEVATSTCQDYLDTEPCQVLLDAQSRGAPLSPRASRVLRQKRGLGLSGLQRAQRPAFAGLRVSVDLAGGLSKLAPALARMVASQRAIRRRACPPRPRRRSLLQLSRPDEAALQEAETAYLSGRSLKAIAKEVGIGHERLSRLLRERGVRLRNQSPTREETAQMKTRYTEGMSLERIGAVLGYSPGTVRAHLLAAQVVMRDSHGR